MSDVNHRLSKALVKKYGPGTLFVLEDLENISQDDKNFKSAKQTHDLRNWAFYDLETKLTYKAHETGSDVRKVAANYTSQRCPRCGRIHKENRNHDRHIYICDKCGFQTNDDRIGAMNIWLLGTLWVSGTDNPAFKAEAPA
jgi:putative transposase